MKKRIIIFSLFVGISISLWIAFEQIAGTFYDIKKYELSQEATDLIEKSFDGIDEYRDYHAHLVGIGQGHHNCGVNEDMQNPWNFLTYLRYRIYLKASGIEEIEKTDVQYIERMVSLIENGFQPKSKLLLLAFDKHYDKNGNINNEKTQFYVSNEYVDSICQKYPAYFEPCISVHPYRKDAVQELEKWAKKGVKQVKWLPNAMGMNPSAVECEPYYEVMKTYEMTLLSHAGHEKAVHAEEDQQYGNPLLLKKPLGMGVKVIVAHCAGLGENIDFESAEKPFLKNIELFMRMMADTNYTDLLFADISAITQYNRLESLDILLQKPSIHHRLVNGSDYPLPAINVLIHTKKMEKIGYISEQERNLLNEIYHYNPLLFDFVLKRTIKHPVSNNKFCAQVFQKNSQLGY